MTSASADLIRQLERRQAEIRRDCLAFLGELERRGLRKDQRLDEVSQRKFDRFRAESRAVEDRIAELREEDARSFENSPYANLGKGGNAPASRANSVAPIGFDLQDLKQAHEALSHGESRTLTARAFNSSDSLLPSQLFPSVIGNLAHDNRILDRLPTFAMDAPSLEYIRHTATTGTPTIVAEGALKPELVFTIDRVIETAVKIAAHAGVSWEVTQDHDAFVSYVQTELSQQVIDVENNEFLNGDGTAGHMTGLLSTSGILTHTIATETPLDAVEQAIAQLRVGSSLATADLLILHPSTWSGVRRSKDTQGRYLATSDPTVGEANSAWGVPVLVTTQIATGTGLLLDTKKFGRALVREPLTLRVGFANDDFVKNIVRYVAEERLLIAVERPSAALKITGLPTS